MASLARRLWYDTTHELAMLPIDETSGGGLFAPVVRINRYI